jgi:hypothetical protein
MEVVRHNAPVGYEPVHAVAQRELIEEDDRIDGDQCAGDEGTRVDPLAGTQRIMQ